MFGKLSNTFNSFDSEKKKLIWFYFISALFVIANSAAMYFEINYLVYLPFGIILLIIALYSLEYILLLIVFFTPLSVGLYYLVPGLDVDLFLPTEPLLAAIMIVTLYKYFINRNFELKFFLHPISLTIIASLLWIGITALASTHTVVSIKFLISRLWFVVPLFFVAVPIFAKQIRIKQYIWLYISPIIFVIIFTLNNHFSQGESKELMVYREMFPFFKDHTSYGAALAMLLPVTIGFTFFSDLSKNMKRLAGIASLILAAGILYSYTRAAWISLVIATGVFMLVYFKIKFRYIFVGSVIGILVLIFSWTTLIKSFERNQADSSGDLSQHAKSITNISTDNSNKERVNRWMCALFMFQDKPITGWGPGTYQFNYAPFQETKYKTWVSTNQGNIGNAHSEYLGALSEQGLLGALLFILLGVLVIYYGLKVYQRATGKEHKMIALTCTLGLITYFAHGVLNNYLDTDKLSVLFWGYIAIIVAMDIYHYPLKKEQL